MPETEYVPFTMAARLLGISDAALRRRVRKGLIPTHSDPLDFRFRLVRVSDLDQFLADRRLLGAGEGEVA
jgi:helix-turn-helix protein